MIRLELKNDIIVFYCILNYCIEFEFLVFASLNDIFLFINVKLL